MLYDGVLDPVLRVLAAGVEVLLGVSDVWELLRVRGDAWDVYYAADVYAAPADEDADAWLLLGDVALRRELDGLDLRAPDA